MFPSRQNTETSDRQIHQVVWTLERATDLMGLGTELVFPSRFLAPAFLTSSYFRTMALMIDYGEKAKTPPFSTSLKVANLPFQEFC